LSSLLIEGVDVAESVLRVRVRTATSEAICPWCERASRRVHAWHVRQLADLPVTGRRLLIELRVRRLVCQNAECPQRTFRQQVPELALRCARRRCA
jgi:transposase